MKTAIERTYDTLFHKSFVPWQFHARHTNFEPTFGPDSVSISQVLLSQQKADPEDILRPDVGSVDESYTLDVGTDGSVTVTANSSIGLAHGLTTFTQLFYLSSANKGSIYTTLAPVSISDSPVYAWRGLNVDTSRTYKPMKQLFQTIDALAYTKMNRLHWHITDAQAWPLEVPALPELSKQGSYTSDQVYTVADVAAIQKYGALRGVSVAMEIDNPGHTSSIAYSHPDLIAAFNVQPNWDTYAAEPPSGTLKLNSPAVSKFLETLLGDLLPRLKPWTAYFHLGGDEVNKNAYTLDDTVKSADPAVLQPLMQKYMDRNMNQVTSAGLVPLVWEEMLLDWNLTLPSNTIIQTWISPDSVAAVTAKGYRALVGQYEFWYLDCGFGQWLDFYPGTSSESFWPYQDYCAPMHNWRVMYSYDPLAGVPASQQHLVIGGEAHIWSEQTDEANFHQMVWPRAATVAEILWSGAKDPLTGQNRSQVTASPRLADLRERLSARGVRAAPVRMPFCQMNSTLDQCAL